MYYDEETDVNIELEFIQVDKYKFYFFNQTEFFYYDNNMLTRYLRVYEKVTKLKQKEVDIEGYDLEEFTVKELKEIARTKQIHFPSQVKKEDLIDMIEQDYELRRDISKPGKMKRKHERAQEELTCDKNFCSPIALSFLTGIPVSKINQTMIEKEFRTAGLGTSITKMRSFLIGLGFTLKDKTDIFFDKVEKAYEDNLLNFPTCCNLNQLDFIIQKTNIFKANKRYLISSFLEKDPAKGHVSAVVKKELVESYRGIEMIPYTIDGVYEVFKMKE